MKMRQVLRLFDYWRQSPPTHELMAAHVGYEPPKAMNMASAKLPSGNAGKQGGGKRIGGAIMVPR